MASIKQLVPLTSAATRRRTVILIVGDACMFVIFAAVGRASHHEASGLGAFLSVLQTAAPFAIGWFVVAPFLGAYRDIGYLQPALYAWAHGACLGVRVAAGDGAALALHPPGHSYQLGKLGELCVWWC